MHAEIQLLALSFSIIFITFPCYFVSQDQFVEFGGIVHDNEKVLDIQPGSVISIHTTKKSYKAKSVVITVGKTLKYELIKYIHLCEGVKNSLSLVLS